MMRILLSTLLMIFSCLLAACAAQQATSLRPIAQSLPHERVYFDFDRDALHDTARTQVQSNATYMQEDAEQVVLLEGHADSVGPSDYNEALGERRARSVAEGLIEAGVAPERIAGVVSYGEDVPLEAGHRSETGASDRRVEMLVW